MQHAMLLHDSINHFVDKLEWILLEVYKTLFINIPCLNYKELFYNFK